MNENQQKKMNKKNEIILKFKQMLNLIFDNRKFMYHWTKQLFHSPMYKIKTQAIHSRKINKIIQVVSETYDLKIENKIRKNIEHIENRMEYFKKIYKDVLYRALDIIFISSGIIFHENKSFMIPFSLLPMCGTECVKIFTDLCLNKKYEDEFKTISTDFYFYCKKDFKFNRKEYLSYYSMWMIISNIHIMVLDMFHVSWMDIYEPKCNYNPSFSKTRVKNLQFVFNEDKILDAEEYSNLIKFQNKLYVVFLIEYNDMLNNFQKEIIKSFNSLPFSDKAIKVNMIQMLINDTRNKIRKYGAFDEEMKKLNIYSKRFINVHHFFDNKTKKIKFIALMNSIEYKQEKYKCEKKIIELRKKQRQENEKKDTLK